MCDNNEIRGQEVYRRVWKKERKRGMLQLFYNAHKKEQGIFNFDKNITYVGRFLHAIRSYTCTTKHKSTKYE